MRRQRFVQSLIASVCFAILLCVGCQSMHGTDSVDSKSRTNLLAAVEWCGGYTMIPEFRIDFAVWNTGDVLWWSAVESHYQHTVLNPDQLQDLRDRIAHLPQSDMQQFGPMLVDEGSTIITLPLSSGRLREYHLGDFYLRRAEANEASRDKATSAWLEARRELLAMRPKEGGEIVEKITPTQQLIELTFPGQLNDYSEMGRSFTELENSSR